MRYVPPLTEAEIEELLAEDAWAQRNMLEGIMDNRDMHYEDARREGCTATRGALNLGATGWDFRPETKPDRSSWWLVAMGVAATVIGLALLPHV